MSCCPDDSIGYLAPNNSDTGHVSSAHGTEFYTVGTMTAPQSKVIVLFPGWNGGRIRDIATLLSKQGHVSIIPKILTPFEEGTDGDGVSGTFDMGTRRQEIFSPGTWFSQQHYHGSIEQKMNGILQYIRETYSGRPISTIGFCWGGYALCHFAKSAPEIVSGVIAHPSIHVAENFYGENIQELVSHVKFPLLLLPAGNDPSMYHKGGVVFETIHSNNKACDTTTFPDMQHGWVVRGDMSNPAIERDVEIALRMIEEYFQKY